MIAEAIALHLAASGLGTVGADLFVGFQPDSPHAVVTLYDEGAVPEDYHSAFATDAAGLQVLVRATDYRDARDRARAIHRRVAGLSGDVGGVLILSTSIVTPPASLGQDERGRSEWTAHYRFRVKDTEANPYRPAL